MYFNELKIWFIIDYYRVKPHTSISMRMNLRWHILSMFSNESFIQCWSLVWPLKYGFPLFELGCECFKFQNRIINIRQFGKPGWTWGSHIHIMYSRRNEMTKFGFETTKNSIQKFVSFRGKLPKVFGNKLFLCALKPETEDNGWRPADRSKTSCNRLASKWLRNWD